MTSELMHQDRYVGFILYLFTSAYHEERLFWTCKLRADCSNAGSREIINGDWKAFEEKVKATPIDLLRK